MILFHQYNNKLHILHTYYLQTAADRPLLAQSPQQNSPQPHSGIASQSGRGASVMKGMPAFPGSHDLRFCQFVADRSKHLLKPVRFTSNRP